jgi:hypothetical protein
VRASEVKSGLAGALAAVTGLALTLAACQQIDPQPMQLNEPEAIELEPELGDSAALPSEAGYGLHLVNTGEHIKLAYGLPQSDAVRLMLQCEPGSGAIEVSDNAPNEQPELTLRAGGQQTTLRGEIQPGILSPIVVARAAPDNVALNAFRADGRMEVTAGGTAYAITVHADESASVENFFSACETA